MNRSRKSTLGTGRCAKLGHFPIRLDTNSFLKTGREKSPLGSGRMTPSPTNLMGGTSHCGLGRRVTNGATPIRPSDLSSREASICFTLKKSPKTPKSPKSRYFSVKKSPKIPKSPKSRKCLYQDKAQENEGCSRQESVFFKPAVRSLRKPATGAFSEKSRIPKPPSVKNAKPVTKSQTTVSSQAQESSACLKPNTSRKAAFSVLKPSTSKQSQAQANSLEDQQRVLQELQAGLQEQRNILKEQQDTLQEQRNTLQEQRNILQEQRDILQEIKTIKSSVEEILQKQKNKLDEAKSFSDHDFTFNEKAIAELGIVDNSKLHLPASETAYRQMRKSLRCLGTPTLLSCRKKARTPGRTPQIKTPRTSLSNKVRTQLHDLLDD